MLQRFFGFQKGERVQVQTITPAELQQRLRQKEKIVVIDVRSPGEYSSNGHIRGSRLLPLPNLAQRGSELPTDRTIVCVCHSGRRSHIACEQLAGMGYTDVLNMSGGMLAWQRENLPVKR